MCPPSPQPVAVSSGVLAGPEPCGHLVPTPDQEGRVPFRLAGGVSGGSGRASAVPGSLGDASPLTARSSCCTPAPEPWTSTGDRGGRGAWPLPGPQCGDGASAGREETGGAWGGYRARPGQLPTLNATISGDPVHCLYGLELWRGSGSPDPSGGPETPLRRAETRTWSRAPGSPPDRPTVVPQAPGPRGQPWDAGPDGRDGDVGMPRAGPRPRHPKCANRV